MADDKSIVQVSDVDPSKKNSAFTGEQKSSSSAEGNACYWNGAWYKDGTNVCYQGKYYWCENGAWAKGGDC